MYEFSLTNKEQLLWKLFLISHKTVMKIVTTQYIFIQLTKNNCYHPSIYLYAIYIYQNQSSRRVESRITYWYSARTDSLRLLPTLFDFFCNISLGVFPNELGFVDQSSRDLSWDPPTRNRGNYFQISHLNTK
jgi:hypothetical protein